MKTVTVYLVRHGQTWFNRFNKMQGWSDSPLTDQGIADAKRAGDLLSISPSRMHIPVTPCALPIPRAKFWPKPELQRGIDYHPVLPRTILRLLRR